MLYKYRNLTNLMHTLDIMIYSRLFAAKFDTMNDPMEGYYEFQPNSAARGNDHTVRTEKAKLGVVSLSETERSALMWSHYADNHRGIVIGVKINEEKYSLTGMRYVNSLEIEENSGHNAESLLSRKLAFWSYEKEKRVFLSSETFLPVELCKLIFGIRSDKCDQEILEKIIRKVAPTVTIEFMQMGLLE